MGLRKSFLFFCARSQALPFKEEQNSFFSDSVIPRILQIRAFDHKVEFFEDDANYPLLVLNREKGWLNYCYTLFGENGDILGAFETLAAGKPNMFWLAKKVQESVPKEKIAEITLTVEEQNGDYLDSDTLDDEGLIKMLQCGKLNSKIESSIWK